MVSRSRIFARFLIPARKEEVATTSRPLNFPRTAVSSRLVPARDQWNYGIVSHSEILSDSLWMIVHSSKSKEIENHGRTTGYLSSLLMTPIILNVLDV